MNDEPDTDEQVVKRRRTGIQSKPGRRRVACQTCRLRKLKCDNARPECALCRTSGSECHYLENTTDPLTLEKAVRLLSGRLDGVSQQIEALQASATLTAAREHRSPVSSILAGSTSGQSHLLLPPLVDQTHPRPSRNFSEIPPHRTTCDMVLLWPVFEGVFPPNHFIEQHLGHMPSPELGTNPLSRSVDIYEVSVGFAPLDEDRIPFLVDNFLENVHTKNPILDVEELVKLSREYAHRGLTWDAWSCLLLITCALGTIAQAFGPEAEVLDQSVSLEAARHIACPSKERQMAENCFVQACRRMGLLKPSILSAQCHFFAGVYLMYTLRPMLSWQHFHQASISFQLYLKTNGRLSSDNCIIDNGGVEYESDRDHCKKHLEQRLYWSCFKSECEFRVELPLPQSDIASYEHPNLFPSPPSALAKGDVGSVQESSPLRTANDQYHLRGSITANMDDVKLHAKKLCNEEESWYYYLTEVALRRIGNRIINTFFRHDPKEWLNIEPFLDIAIEFESQVSSWWANLPPAMQTYETNSTIRAPRIASPGGALAGHVTQELSWATENRLLEMKSWLCQPFIYYLVHVRPIQHEYGTSPSPVSPATGASIYALSPNSEPVFWNLIHRAIECNLTILDTRSIPHRHHGLWYDLRAIVCAALVLLSIIKSGYEYLIPGGRSSLLDDPDHNAPYEFTGRIGRVLRQLEIWSCESPDMQRHKEVLEHLVTTIVRMPPERGQGQASARDSINA